MKKKKASQITIDDLIAELNNAREVALLNNNATAMISATMAKAKLCGLDKGEALTVKLDVPVGLAHFYGKSDPSFYPAIN